MVSHDLLLYVPQRVSTLPLGATVEDSDMDGSTEFMRIQRKKDNPSGKYKRILSSKGAKKAHQHIRRE